MRLNDYSYKNILFIDIETVSDKEKFFELSPQEQELWKKKTRYYRNEETTIETLYEEKAAIWAEFGRIVCISCGLIVDNKIRIKSFTGKEKKLLEDFKELLQSSYFQNSVVLCAHNGKEFDFPYLSRRMLINNITLPDTLQYFGKKPWEVEHLDTLELWKFGDYKHYTSLELMSHILGVESSKQDMSGADVGRVYYEEKDVEKIKKYCEGDVVTLINVFRRLRFDSILSR